MRILAHNKSTEYVKDINWQIVLKDEGYTQSHIRITSWSDAVVRKGHGEDINQHKFFFTSRLLQRI